MASAYGWSKAQILDDVFLDEALDYLDSIKEDKLQAYYMQAIIVSNPHTKDPKKLLTSLDEELRRSTGGGILEEEPEEGAFEKLRTIFNKKQK